jgi:tetraprenyl-beta-curcumene synthase
VRRACAPIRRRNPGVLGVRTDRQGSQEPPAFGSVLDPEERDPAPLRLGQVWALLQALLRELLWGLRAVSGEVDAWRVRARTIPDAPLRADALDSIARKRAHADGAALFWILPRRRHSQLLALLVAYQTIWDYLDGVSERGAELGERNGRHLHRALVEALDPRGAICDHYRHHLCAEDGGYMRALIDCCRGVCGQLPAYELVRPLVLTEAARCAIQSLNHNPDPAGREHALRAWAAGEGEEEGLSWFELSAAASASLAPHVLLALAAEEICKPGDVAAAHAAYLPWASLATAMLDSYADRMEDARRGDHSYIAHYEDDEEAVQRLGEIVDRALRAAGGLRMGHRHTILVACVVAMYLSKDSARIATARAATRSLAHSGGSLVRLLLPLLRAWRIAHGQRAA